MAKMNDNNATHGIRGKVNQLVYSQRNGETVVSKPPIRTAPYSEAQHNINSIFKQAVLYARSILQNAAIKLAYKKKSKAWPVCIQHGNCRLLQSTCDRFG